MIHSFISKYIYIYIYIYAFIYKYICRSLYMYAYIYIFIYMYIHITNVQNICNLIGRKTHNIGRILLSLSTMYSLTNTKNISFRGRKNRNYLIRNKLVTNRQGKY